MKRINKISGVLLIILTFFLIQSCKKVNDYKIIDKDGNVYQSITIGTQVWMVQNLQTTRYNDGTHIPVVTDSVQWFKLTESGYCWYKNDIRNKQPYGALYNWYAVNTGKLCPTGWHVPTDKEWSALRDTLGGKTVAGGKLKETGGAHWLSPNTSATNETGFTALPGGQRDKFRSFWENGTYASWWSSTEFCYPDFTCPSGGYWKMGFNSSNLYNFNVWKEWGFSVRCIKDN